MACPLPGLWSSLVSECSFIFFPLLFLRLFLLFWMLSIMTAFILFTAVRFLPEPLEVVSFLRTRRFLTEIWDKPLVSHPLLVSGIWKIRFFLRYCIVALCLLWISFRSLVIARYNCRRLHWLSPT